MVSNLPVGLKNSTCAFSGHRSLDEDFSREILKLELEEIIRSGYDTFLTGMAIGFDTECFLALDELKKTYTAIKICAVIPCADQDKSFDENSKKLYAELLQKADYTAREEKNYFRGCMLKRNDFLIDNSSLLYAYYDGRKTGGTYYTVNKAQKKGLTVKIYNNL